MTSPLGSSVSVDNYTNLNSLDGVKKLGRNGDPQALREVARQFESLFIAQLLKTMRATEAVFAEGNYTQSNEMQFHRDLMDQQMSLELSKGRGFGLAESLYRQLSEQYGKLLPPAQPTANPAATVIPAATKAPVFTASEETPSPIAKVQAAAAGSEPKIAKFIDKIWDHAVIAADKLGVATEGLIAQAALETGWGEHVIHDERGRSSNNLFNIKADGRWDGDAVTKTSMEFIDQAPVSIASAFRQYPNLAHAFDDLVGFLSNSERYKDVVGQPTVADYAGALQQAGYATDPRYAEKINRIAGNADFQKIVAQKLLD